MRNICLTASSAFLLMSATALAQQDMEEHPMTTAEPAEECLNELDQLEREAEQARLSHSTQEEVRQLTETARMLGERGRDEACNTMVDTINTITEEEQMRMGQQRTQQAASQAQRVTEYKDIVRASSINGATVRNTQNEELGTIEDTVIDPQSGEISYVVLSVGGFLGVGEKFIGIPWDELSIVEDRDSGDTHYVVEANRQDLQNREGLDKENWPRSVSSRWDSSKSQQEKSRKRQ